MPKGKLWTLDEEEILRTAWNGGISQGLERKTIIMRLAKILNRTKVSVRDKLYHMRIILTTSQQDHPLLESDSLSSRL